MSSSHVTHCLMFLWLYSTFFFSALLVKKKTTRLINNMFYVTASK